MKTVVNLNSDVYYKGIYWNDYDIVQKYMSKDFTGDEKKWWIKDFQEKYAKNPFEHALFLNCGDGRFEREFIDKRIVKKVTAFDISPDLIEKAKKAKGRRKITYKIADANKITFPRNEFDLVVNIAALHHVQYLNRMCRILANTLKPGGILVSFDYVGPSRNQYLILQWLIAQLINITLPRRSRQRIHYPHLPTMLVTDPTEAIHSALIVNYLQRYFQIIERNDTGGGVAYLLLTHNRNINLMSKRDSNALIKKILKYDKLLTKLSIVPPMFSYIVVRPNKGILGNKELLRRLQQDENKREFFSKYRRGVYSTSDYMKLYLNKNSIKNYVKLTYDYLIYIYMVIKTRDFDIKNLR